MSNVAYLDPRDGAREPPHDFDAEKAVLGAILMENPALFRVQEFLKPEHFADPLHGMIYKAMAGLIDRNQVATPITLSDFFERDDFKDVGGARPYLARLAGSAVHIIDAADYGRRIHDLYLRRRLVEVGAAMVNAAMGPQDRPADALITDAEASLFAVAENGTADDRLLDAPAGMAATFARIDEAIADANAPDDQKTRRITTGLEGLDAKLRIDRGDLVFIAGATSSGKSALADNIAENNELAGIGAGIFTMEMKAPQWLTRRLARATGINSYVITGGKLRQDEYNRLEMTRREIQQRPFWIDDTPGLSVAQLRARMRRLKRRHGIGLAIVDYLQLMRPDSVRRGGTRAEEIGEMTRSLKGIASELDIALIVLSQINRGVNSRDDKRPDLGDLRESGSIEQDANTVIFVYREEYYLSRGKAVGKGGKPPTPQEEMDFMARVDAAKGKAEIIVAKQREGEAPFTVTCSWDGVRTRFGGSAQEEML
jgi:replicative DNA helicase